MVLIVSLRDYTLIQVIYSLDFVIKAVFENLYGSWTLPIFGDSLSLRENNDIEENWSKIAIKSPKESKLGVAQALFVP